MVPQSAINSLIEEGWENRVLYKIQELAILQMITTVKRLRSEVFNSGQPEYGRRRTFSTLLEGRR